MKGVGHGRVEELLRALRRPAVDVADELRDHGHEVDGAQFGTIAYDLVKATGSVDTAIGVAFDLWRETAKSKHVAIVIDAAKSGRGPRREKQPYAVRLFFKSTGRPTLLGAVVLEHLKPQQPARRARRTVDKEDDRRKLNTARAGETAPRVAGRWDIICELVRTRLTEVFEASDGRELLGRVVLKRSNDRAALRREFEVNRILHHDNICRYLSIDEDESFGCFIVMEHGGVSLEEVIENEGSTGLDEALRVVKSVGKALAYAERKHVLHQDIKPANILIDDSGHVRVTDFNVAVHGRPTVRADGAGTVVGTSMVGFTPGYGAPEQERFELPRSASDQYSLALVFCSMIEGRVFSQQDRYVLENLDDLSPGQMKAVKKALSPLPDQRFPSIDDFLDGLKP